MSSALKQQDSPRIVVAPLPPAKLDTYWPTLEAMLARVPGIGERFDLENVRQWLTEGKLQAWGIVDTATQECLACFCTEVCGWPMRRVLRIPFIAGGEMERWIGAMPAFEAWVWDQEPAFDEIELAGRPGWSRVVAGYHERARVLVKERPRV